MCSSALANYFIDKAKEDKIDMTNLKLQKLMFIGYGWVLATLDKELTSGEQFQAWQHGPVLLSIYHEMKRFGSDQIKDRATEFYNEDNKLYIPTIRNKEVLDVLDIAWETYKDFSAWSLRELTHEKESPWKEVYQEENKFNNIDKKIVQAYYKNYLDELIEKTNEPNAITQ